jgi:hypothetical protein
MGPILLLVVGPALRKVFLREYVHSPERVPADAEGEEA